MSLTVLSILILISALFAIVARQREQMKLYALLKPLTTMLVIAIAIWVYGERPSTYSTVMVASLVLALIGDVLLLKERLFTFGLGAFLLAHIGFTCAFASIAGFHLQWPPLALMALIGGGFYLYMFQHLKQYALPVAIYICAIVAMNWQAIALAFYNDMPVFWVIAAASLLFSFSDAVIAYNKFKSPFRMAEPLILSTYWLAIYVFALGGYSP